jgi:ketosteroid isomerase-like protein
MHRPRRASKPDLPGVVGEKEGLMSGELSKQIVEAIYGEFLRGDADALMARLHPDIIVTMHGPASIPYAGIRRGPAQVGAWFGEIAAAVAIERMTPQMTIGSDDMVVVQGVESGRSTVTGRGYSSAFVHIWTLRDGLVLRMDDFVDSAAVAAALAA